VRLKTFDHRQAVGGMWDEIGQAQFDFLLQQGLQPDHQLIDIGCGSLRAGVHLVRYLEPGHYAGIDIDEPLIKGGRRELKDVGLTDKEPDLIVNGQFDLSRFGRKFDFALAQSVFTHLPVNPIVRCLREVEAALVPGGRFFATFNEIDTRLGMTDRDPFLYDRDIFRWAVEGSSLDFEYLGLWGHPRGTHPMLVFTKSPGSPSNPKS
jgi:SAM-dependent methyltransferase